ncbi:MAG: DUF2877 domain-containing protein [Halanaerobiales bacterium]|nr:DUF2877 domain-containing protein [Halanaerobiales bacterium]
MKPLKGKIHSIFRSVINIELDGDLYTIGKPKIGNGPFTVLLDQIMDDLNLIGLEQGDLVLIDEKGILLKNFVLIDLSNSLIWNSEWQMPPELEEIFKIVPFLKDFVLQEGNLDGIGALLIRDANKREKVFDNKSQGLILNKAIPLIEKMLEGLRTYSASFWCDLIEFVGLGPGLTPSSDDFLVGFLLTFRYLEVFNLVKLPKLDFSDFDDKIKCKTNLISASGVIQAANGQPFELIRDLLQSSFSGNRIQTILSALRLMDRGSTSGTDILTGIIYACQTFQAM